MSVIYEHSTDKGETWKVIEVGSRSVVAHRLQSQDAGVPIDDGFGNWYRWSVDQESLAEATAMIEGGTTEDHLKRLRGEP